MEHRVSLYADDLLLYINNPMATGSRIVSLLKVFIPKSINWVQAGVYLMLSFVSLLALAYFSLPVQLSRFILILIFYIDTD